MTASRSRSRLGRAVVALRWPIIAIWIAVGAFATSSSPTIDEAQDGALGDLVPNDSEALDAELRSSELFDSRSSARRSSSSGTPTG